MRASDFRYNGYGGKPEPGESMLDCAVRELHVSSMHLLDIVLFWLCIVHVPGRVRFGCKQIWSSLQGHSPYQPTRSWYSAWEITPKDSHIRLYFLDRNSGNVSHMIGHTDFGWTLMIHTPEGRRKWNQNGSTSRICLWKKWYEFHCLVERQVIVSLDSGQRPGNMCLLSCSPSFKINWIQRCF